MNGFAVPEIRLVTTPMVPMTACCSKPDVAKGWSVEGALACSYKPDNMDDSQMYDVFDESE